jgi:diacylglycerol kinase family enzyme
MVMFAALDEKPAAPPPFGTGQLKDVGRANKKFFLNVASGGFGAEVTASTSPEMKRLFGGGAYSVMGALMALNFRPYGGRMVLPDKEDTSAAIVGAVGNGRTAGGGLQVAPLAYIDDGLLDVLVVNQFKMADLGQVVEELFNLSSAGARDCVRIAGARSLAGPQAQGLAPCGSVG